MLRKHELGSIYEFFERPISQLCDKTVKRHRGCVIGVALAIQSHFYAHLSGMTNMADVFTKQLDNGIPNGGHVGIPHGFAVSWRTGVAATAAKSL